jgi:hypothetical protein
MNHEIPVGSRQEGKGWDNIPTHDQEHLIEWYNVREEDVDDEDRARLADLWHEGHFHHFECAECGETVRHGEPDDWGHFQGACQDEYMGELCGDCYGVYERLKYYAGE